MGSAHLRKLRLLNRMSPLLTIFYCVCVVNVVYGGDRIPQEFNQICRLEDTLLEKGGQSTAIVLCQPGANDNQIWRLDILRNWSLSTNNDLERFSYELICENGGHISLPMPIKCPGLISLTVRNCNITDSFKDFGNSMIDSIPSSLKKLEIYDSNIVQKKSKIFEMYASVDKITSDYECLHAETLEEKIYRNVSYLIDDDIETLLQECMGDLLDMFNKNSSDIDPPVGIPDFNVTKEPPKDDDLSSTMPKTEVTSPPMNEINSRRKRSTGKCAFLNVENLLNVPKSLNDLDIKCTYEKLRILEDSSNSIMSVLETKFLEKYNKYPVLEVFNYSNNNIDVIPPELTDWSFLFDNLIHLDLSHNRIKTFSFKSTFSSNTQTYVNLQFNNITTLTSSDLHNLRKEQTLFVDIKNNPIECNCDLTDFIEAITKETAQTLSRYGYLRDLTCSAPSRLAGRQLKTLTMEDLGCNDLTANNAAVYVILGMLLIAVIILIVIVYLYREQIKVLVRSRHKEDPKSEEHRKKKLEKFHTIIDIKQKRDDTA